jgi:hypothetical protein
MKNHMKIVHCFLFLTTSRLALPFSAPSKHWADAGTDMQPGTSGIVPAI